MRRTIKTAVAVAVAILLSASAAQAKAPTCSVIRTKFSGMSNAAGQYADALDSISYALTEMQDQSNSGLGLSFTSLHVACINLVDPAAYFTTYGRKFNWSEVTTLGQTITKMKLACYALDEDDPISVSTRRMKDITAGINKSAALINTLTSQVQGCKG